MTSMSPSSMESRSVEQPRQACIIESRTDMSAALLRLTMGMKDVDSRSTLRTRLAFLQAAAQQPPQAVLCA